MQGIASLLLACCLPALAGSPLPAWQSMDSASALAAEVDAVHAQVTSVVRQRQLNPLRAARLFAAVRVAQYEALRELPTLPVELVAQVSASQALTWMLPQEDASRWAVPAVAALAHQRGITGMEVDRINLAIVPTLSVLLDDRADARRRPLVKPEARPGLWLRTPPLFAEQPTEPQGDQWQPWCPGSDRLAVPPAVQHGSAQWREEVRQVLETTRSLSTEQKAIAQAWHLDAGSITPPGVWNAIATAYLADQSVPPARRLRVLALLNMAMQDALVAAWRIKLQFWSERPITAVRRELDPTFDPLLVTPPFPGYVSGHATVSAAAAGVLSHFFPGEQARWQALAQEAALSRLYGGIHFASDNEQGMVLGERVARQCLASYQPSGPGDSTPLVTVPARSSPDFFALPRMRAQPE